MAKQTPDLVINRGTHLTTCLNTCTGEFKLAWDWDKLLEEVQAATSGKVVAKKNLVKETESKVTKTRTKKTVSTQVTDAVTAKKPVTKKAPAKKAKK